MKKDFSVVEASISELSKAMKEGEVTSRELVLLYLGRIADFDKSGPKLNSVLEINPDALHIAEAMDREREMGTERGPLHGIPVLIKDNINTGDRMHTSAGSLAFKDNYAPYDSFVAEKLRDSGAVILGKANLTEFANFMTENMPNGYSSRGGQVLNPYGPGKFDTGGSSSGSGASAAASLCAAAVGTETSGSILSPSNQHSLVGVKPTVGLISRTGIIPISHSQDTAGPMTRTVEDAAILLGALSGADAMDPATLSGIGKAHTDYTQFLDRDGLKDARIGVPRKYFLEYMPEEELLLFNGEIENLRSFGAEIIDPCDIESAKELTDYDVLIYEFKSDMNSYLASLGNGAPVNSLREIIEFNNCHAEECLKYGQTLLTKCNEISGTLTEPEYINARLRDLRISCEEGIDKVMEENNLDALLFPSTYGCFMAAKAGYPSVIVPAGYTKEGEPFGITFTGMAYSEPTLIKLAYSYEQNTGKRVPPKL